jgi:hypothetical protein
MVESDPFDTDHTDGKMYYYITTLGSRPYANVTFSASDGIATTQLVVQGPKVIQERTFPNSVGDIEVTVAYVGPNSVGFIPVTSPPSTYPPGLFPIGVYVELYLDTIFLKEANITFNYTIHNVEEMNVTTLAVYRWVVTDQGASWEYLKDSTVDNVTGLVKAPIPSLQNDIYTVLGNKENPPPNNPPVAVIMVDGVTYKDGDTVNKKYAPDDVIKFDGSMSYDPDKDSLNDELVLYSWTFGDGESSEGKVTQHSYKGTDKYEVTLTVRDSFGELNTVRVVVSVSGEESMTLLYFLVLVGIIVILILLFFPKGRPSPAEGRKSEAKEAPRSPTDEVDEEEADGDEADEDDVTTELDDIIDELEVDRG